MTVIKPNAIAGINSITVASGSALAVHKADGTLIQTIAGTSGVSTFSAISVGSATTTNDAEKSINIGLGASISQHNDNSLSFGTNGDERFQVNDNGKILIATTTTSEAHANQDELIIGSSSDDANHGITIVTPNDKYGTIAYSDGSGGTSQGLLEYNHSGDFFRIYTAASERLRITSSGRVNTVGIVSATGGLQVGAAATIKSDGNATFAGIVTATAFKGDGSGLSGVTAVTINSNADNRVITGSDTANTLNGESNLTFDGLNINQSMSSDGRGLIQTASGNNYIINSVNANRSSANDLIAMLEARWNSTHVADISFHAGSDTTNKDDGYISLRTSASAGGISERMKIDSTGNVTISDGDLVIGTSGHGIDFSATGDGSASASNELLDDYEEGGWTPTANVGTVSVASAGVYTKVGRMVQLTVLLYNFSDTSSGTSIIIGGVPYTASGQYVGSVWLRRTTTGNKNYNCIIGDSSTTLINIKHDSNGSDMGGDLVYSDFAHSTPYMNITLTYQTA